MKENEAIERIRKDVCNNRCISQLCNDGCMYGHMKCAFSMAIQALEEVQQYRAIGTPEECRAAEEKQKAKKIEIFNGQASCPNCKHLFGGMDVIKSLIAWDMPHCNECGQCLDWSDEE